MKMKRPKVLARILTSVADVAPLAPRAVHSGEWSRFESDVREYIKENAPYDTHVEWESYEYSTDKAHFSITASTYAPLHGTNCEVTGRWYLHLEDITAISGICKSITKWHQGCSRDREEVEETRRLVARVERTKGTK